MISLSYEDRIEIAFQEGRTAALTGSDLCRFTPDTPMHASWLQGRTEGLQDRGWQPLAAVAKRVVQRIRVSDDD